MITQGRGLNRVSATGYGRGLNRATTGYGRAAGLGRIPRQLNGTPVTRSMHWDPPDINSPQRGTCPEHVFLDPANRRYPYKKLINGQWKISVTGLQSQKRLATLHHDTAIANKQDELLNKLKATEKLHEHIEDVVTSYIETKTYDSYMDMLQEAYGLMEQEVNVLDTGVILQLFNLASIPHSVIQFTRTTNYNIIFNMIMEIFNDDFGEYIYKSLDPKDYLEGKVPSLTIRYTEQIKKITDATLKCYLTTDVSQVEQLNLVGLNPKFKIKLQKLFIDLKKDYLKTQKRG